MCEDSQGGAKEGRSREDVRTRTVVYSLWRLVSFCICLCMSGWEPASTGRTGTLAAVGAVIRRRGSRAFAGGEQARAEEGSSYTEVTSCEPVFSPVRCGFEALPPPRSLRGEGGRLESA